VTSSPAHPSTLGPVALANIQVDVTTRLGATSKPTATGFKRLDTLLAGGLRHGVVLALTGAPGSGRTSLALMMAYMAARASAGVVFASRGIDETEIVARLAARALRRSYPASEVTFGDILSGGAFVNDAVKRAVNAALEAVVEKVGTHLHFARVGPECSLTELAERSTQLWARYERVLLVVDDIEGLAVAEAGPLDARILSVAYALRALADQGCAVVLTGLERHADLVSLAATTLVELHPGPSRDGRTVPLELVVKKNRVGGTGSFTVQTLFGATEFTEV
jgi:KaiC/GvpD/RAD55 family RecA-like ATPase